jgi:integrase
MYADGLGLYLSVSGSGSASWLFRYKIDKRPRTMGLGSLDYVTLAQARELADAARRKVRVDSVDPLEERRAAKVAAGVDRAKAMTFRQCAEAYIRGHRAGWQNAKHSAQWATTLEHYAYPVIGDLPVAAVGLHLVLRILEPIWTTRTATATRLRGRIEAVLSWATTRGLRTGDNPAMWRGRLETLLPAQARITPVEHHKALDYRQIGALMTELRQQESVAARALEFMILTATRTGEVRRAQWSEVDLVERLWTIPAERTKTKKEHRVPLSDAAMAILKHVYEYRLNQYVFPGHHGGAISDNAMLVLAKKFGGADMTAHGFRSTFRDWAAERSSFPNEVAEMALGHTVGGAVERAYRRGDLFDKRRQLAEAWSRYCAAPASEGRVVPIRGFGE